VIPAEFRRFPTHWKVLPFLQVFKDATGGNRKIKKEDFSPNGKLPIVDQGKKYFAGYTNDVQSAIKSELPAIIFGDHTRAFKFIEEPFALGADGVKLLEPIVEADKKYLFYYLKQLKLKSAGYSRHYKFLKEAFIPLPSLPVQKKIAAALEKADTLREQCQKMEQELKSLSQSVFLDMFGDPVTNPMGWKKAGLKEISSKFNDGPFGSNLKTSHYTESGVQVIRLTNIGVGVFKSKDKMFVSEEHAEFLSKYKCRSGDIVIATLGEPNLRACIIPEDVSVAINKADCIHCVPDNSIIGSEYLAELLNLPYTLQTIQNLLHGQTRTRISSGQLAKVEILLPPLQKQQEFIDFIKKRNKELIRVQSLTKEKDDLFNSLMQHAFKGEIEFKDVV